MNKTEDVVPRYLSMGTIMVIIVSIIVIFWMLQ